MDDMTPAAAPNPGYLSNNKFSMAFWGVGGVAAVIWATTHGHKGRFWWFIGGSMIGATVGFVIDEIVNKGK